MRKFFRSMIRIHPLMILAFGAITVNGLNATASILEWWIIPAWEARQERIEAEKERIARLERESWYFHWFATGEPQRLARGMGPYPLN